MEKVRNSSIELLRVFFMFLILTLHAYLHGSHDNFNWIYSLGSDMSTSWNLAMYSITNLGVTGFMIISGYFGIKTTPKSVVHICLIPLFYALIINIVFGVYKNPIRLLFSFDQWWFVSCYVFIMFLAPFVEWGVKNINQKTFGLLVMGMFIYTYAMRFIDADNSHDIIFLLTVYMGARYLRLYPNSIVNKIIIRMGGAASTLLLIICPILIAQLGSNPNKYLSYFIQNNNILLFISSYWIIQLCLSHAFYNKQINCIASGSFAIYIITDERTLRTFLDPWLLPYVLKGYGLLIILGICFTVLFIDIFRSIIFRAAEKTLYFLTKR